MGVNFHHESMRPRRESGPGERTHSIPHPHSVGGIDENREVADLARERDDVEIEGIARVVVESSDPALAQDDPRVAFGEQVFGRHEPFLERRGDAALEEHRTAELSQSLQESEVLHAARPYLKDGVLDSAVLWNTKDLGYLTMHAAHALAKGTLKPGVTSLPAGRLGNVKVEGDQVILGTPFTFTKDNVDQFHF